MLSIQRLKFVMTESKKDCVASDDARHEDLHIALAARAAEFLPDEPAEYACQHRPPRHREGDQQAGCEEHADLALGSAEELQNGAGDRPEQKLPGHAGRDTRLDRRGIDLVDRGLAPVAPGHWTLIY